MLYVAYPPHLSQDRLGLPTFIHRNFTEHFNDKKPMEPLFSTYTPEQLDYHPVRDGLPVPDHQRLPSHLLMVCRNVRRFIPDLYVDGIRQWIVSERFLTFMKQYNLLAGHYEECKLTVMSSQKKPISDKQYYLVRIFEDDSTLIDFEHSPSTLSTVKPLTKKTPPRVYYPDLVFKTSAELPPMLYSDRECFRYGFICREDTRYLMEEEHFLGFNFYTLEEYVRERQYRDKFPYGPPADAAKRV